MSNWTTLSFISKANEIEMQKREPILNAFFNDLKVPVTLHLKEVEPIAKIREDILKTYGGIPLGQNGNVIETIAGTGPLLSAWGDARIKQIYLPRARGAFGTKLFQKLDSVVDALDGTFHVWGQSILLKESLVVGVSDSVDDSVEISCCLEISLHSQDNIPNWFDARESILNNKTVQSVKEWISKYVEDIEIVAITS